MPRQQDHWRGFRRDSDTYVSRDFGRLLVFPRRRRRRRLRRCRRQRRRRRLDHRRRPPDDHRSLAVGADRPPHRSSLRHGRVRQGPTIAFGPGGGGGFQPPPPREKENEEISINNNNNNNNDGRRRLHDHRRRRRRAILDLSRLHVLRALRYAAEYSVRSNGVVDRPGPRTFFSFFGGGGTREMGGAVDRDSPHRSMAWRGRSGTISALRAGSAPSRLPPPPGLAPGRSCCSARGREVGRGSRYRSSRTTGMTTRRPPPPPRSSLPWRTPTPPRLPATAAARRRGGRHGGSVSPDASSRP